MLFRLNLLAFLTAFLFVGDAYAQHCAPITESYLNGTGISRAKNGITFSFQYAKTGGKPKAAYQAYLLAYADSDSNRISELTPQQAIDEKIVTIVNTQLAKRNEAGHYDVRWQLETQLFVDDMLSDNRISVERTTNMGGWKSYQDKIRIAVFIPFLDDEKYSVIDGLPDDKHECHPGEDAALLFETITPKLTVGFGVVQAVRLDEGAHYIEINGNRPDGNNAK